MASISTCVRRDATAGGTKREAYLAGPYTTVTLNSEDQSFPTLMTECGGCTVYSPFSLSAAGVLIFMQPR